MRRGPVLTFRAEREPLRAKPLGDPPGEPPSQDQADGNLEPMFQVLGGP